MITYLKREPVVISVLHLLPFFLNHPKKAVAVFSSVVESVVKMRLGFHEASFFPWSRIFKNKSLKKHTISRDALETCYFMPYFKLCAFT